MSTTSLLTRETAGVFATVKDFPLTNEEVDTNWLTLAEYKLEKSFNLSDLTDVAAARSNLGLDSIALQAADDVSITGGSISGVDLQFTARTLWGQSFDGSGNISGDISNARNIQFGTQSNKATLTYTQNFTRTLTVPAIGGNRTFAFINEAQTFSADQIFSTNVRINSLGVGVAADGTTGNATFTGNVVVNNSLTSNTLVFGTQSSKATLSYVTNTARTLTVPALGGDRTFAFINEPQTFTGTQTFSSTINGNANTASTLETTRTLWGQSFNGSSNISGNITDAGTIQFGTQSNKAILTYTTNTARTLTVPALGGDRTFAFIDETQNFSAAQIFSSNVQISSLGVGTTASGTAGEIRATNNITAFFSDDRLKTRVGFIENAVEKLETLSTFYYEPNEKAQELGYKKERHVGLSAQEVEKILPEVIKPAPIDEEYKTIQYEKLVPLLIAAIQELKQEIRQIKNEK